MGKFFINCDEANHLCDKSQYKETTFFEKIKLTFHLIYCKVCRNYSNNNAKLTDCIKNSKTECMDNSVKESIKKKVNQELTKQKQ